MDGTSPQRGKIKGGGKRLQVKGEEGEAIADEGKQSQVKESGRRVEGSDGRWREAVAGGEE